MEPDRRHRCFDSFDVFEMRMSHAAFLPDEQINPATLAPVFRTPAWSPAST